MNLKEGDTVFAIIKATEVSVESNSHSVVPALSGPWRCVNPLQRAGRNAIDQASHTGRIDLPSKALVWLDAAGKTWLSFNEPIWITRRHGVANADPGVTKMAAALREMSRKAAENVG